jgi:hypothetical protein
MLPKEVDVIGWCLKDRSVTSHRSQVKRLLGSDLRLADLRLVTILLFIGLYRFVDVRLGAFDFCVCFCCEI